MRLLSKKHYNKEKRGWQQFNGMQKTSVIFLPDIVKYKQRFYYEKGSFKMNQ